MKRHVSWLAVLLVGWFASPALAELYPVPLEVRVAQAPRIAIGTVSGQHAYWVDGHGAVTASRVKVAAWLKGRGNDDEVLVLALGGVVGDRATVVVPSLKLEVGQQYLLFLDADETRLDDRSLRRSSPDLRQSFAWADVQGALPLQFGAYRDVFEAPLAPDALLSRIEAQLGQAATTPTGARYFPEPDAGIPPAIRAITNLAPNPTRAGTIDAADFLTITGSGFGAAPGNVRYTNANDGGATFIAPGVASDNVSWSDTSIVNKPVSGAGTGPIRVNDSQTSPGTLTVNWAHIAIDNSFSGFASSTRQRYYQRNMNALGGLSFTYNTAFAGNAPAVAAVERALSTWRCGIGVNFVPAVGTTAIATAAEDGVNVVTFDGTLPAGVLGRATSRFDAGANGACNLQNTVWSVTEIDVQFFPNPPSPGFTWEFGPAAPSASEYDFESVAVHELGHAVGLGHIIAPGLVMHFAILNGASVRTLAARDIEAGQVKMAYSDDPTCFNPAGHGTGPMIPVAPGVCNLVGDTADVAITKTDGSTTEVPGTPVTYTIVASNVGPNTATGVTVADTFAASLSGCSTTSVAAGGASGNAAGPVAGNINDGGITLPMGGSVTFTATCNISAGATGTLVNTATVSAATSDPNSANNSATDTNTLLGNLLFSNGFE